MLNRSALGMLMAVLLALVAGCTSEGKPVSTEEGPPPKKVETADFNMAPKQLLAEVKRVIVAPPISLSVDEESGGSIVTGWKQYPGTWHIARRWQERTRFHITVVPSWDDPTSRSHLQVVEDTQQRAAEIQEWQNAMDLRRPERSAELLEQIRQQIQSRGPTTK